MNNPYDDRAILEDDEIKKDFKGDPLVPYEKYYWVNDLGGLARVQTIIDCFFDKQIDVDEGNLFVWLVQNGYVEEPI